MSAELKKLVAAYNVAKQELESFKNERFSTNLNLLNSKFGEGKVVDIEDSDGICNTIIVFGNNAVLPFYYIGRDSFGSCLKEAGFESLTFLHEDGEIEEFKADDYTDPRKRSVVK